MRTPPIRVEVNGSAATADRPQQLALFNYGHFTAMQLRNGRVRGLDLHLNRLDAATRELFGTSLDAGRIRSLISHALAGDRDASVRVIVFWPAKDGGFDDALLTGPGGVIAEGAITNIAFFSESTVTWPDAPCLSGITMQLLEPRLAVGGLRTGRGPVRLADLPAFAAAFVTNSRGIAPVGRIDATDIPVSPALMKTVSEIYESIPWDPI